MAAEIGRVIESITFGVDQSLSRTQIRGGKLFFDFGHVFRVQDIKPALTQQITLHERKSNKIIYYYYKQNKEKIEKNHNHLHSGVIRAVHLSAVLPQTR